MSAFLIRVTCWAVDSVFAGGVAFAGTVALAVLAGAVDLAVDFAVDVEVDFEVDFAVVDEFGAGVVDVGSPRRAFAAPEILTA